MKKIKLLYLGLIILLISSCSEKVTCPTEIESPEKLSPYETYFDLATFEQRRENLMKNIPDNSIAAITTNDTYLRNGDVNYEFRPASTFLYLTGFDEPNAVAAIRKNRLNLNTTELIMFVEEREGRMLQWLGPVYGPEGAVEFFGADSAYGFQKFGSLINSYLNTGEYESVYANFGTNVSVADSFYRYVEDSITVYNVDEIVNSLRVTKSAIEISSIQKAVDVSVQAFIEALKIITPGVYEYEVEASFNYILRLNGCSRNAFPTIVASGPNINVLHYDANQRQMLDGELVMIDYGAEYG